jgi:hypothetical protein
VGGQTEGQAGRHTYIQTDRQTDRTDGRMGGQTEGQAGRHTYIHTYIQIDRQLDRQTIR